VRDEPARILVRDDLWGHHHEHAKGTAGQGEDELLDVRRARRQVNHQVIQAVPVGIGHQPPDEQLGDAPGDAQALVLAEQERSGGELHAVLTDGLQARVRRARPGEQRDVGRLGAPSQAHHPRHVGAVEVRIHQPGPLSLGGQRQRQVHRDRGLAHAALPARDRDDWYVIRTARHDCSVGLATLAVLAVLVSVLVAALDRHMHGEVRVLAPRPPDDRGHRRAVPERSLPATRATRGIDGWGPPGPPDIMNALDAVPSAARLLCADEDYP
jgi:hypothetical protein